MLPDLNWSGIIELVLRSETILTAASLSEDKLYIVNFSYPSHITDYIFMIYKLNPVSTNLA